MVNLHPALSRQGELVFSTNSDPDDFWKNFNDPGSADYYRPFFYRVFDWQLVYDDLRSQGISTPQVSPKPVQRTSPIYNLQGQRVEHPRRGLYIQHGRKVVLGR